ncbi:MAG: hypothetical protein AAF990_13750 [Bacteroidota bacterium]
MNPSTIKNTACTNGFIVCSLLLLACLSLACNTSRKGRKIPAKEPQLTSFWYYDPVFQLDSNSLLQTEGLYFRILKTDAFGEIYKMFRFYPDGVVLAYIVYNTPDHVINLDRELKGNIHGCYKTQADSIFFTTKVYYEHIPIFYDGQIHPGDSLVLHSKNQRTKEEATHTYYYYKP